VPAARDVDELANPAAIAATTQILTLVLMGKCPPEMICNMNLVLNQAKILNGNITEPTTRGIHPKISAGLARWSNPDPYLRGITCVYLTSSICQIEMHANGDEVTSACNTPMTGIGRSRRGMTAMVWANLPF
jgi:hypothetical protein